MLLDLFYDPCLSLSEKICAFPTLQLPLDLLRLFFFLKWS